MRRAAVAFGLLLPLGVLLLGDLVGAFADAAASFDYFDGTAARVRHFVGAGALAAAGLAFVVLVVHATHDEPAPRARLAQSGAVVFAALLGVSGAAFATVSFSIQFGRLTGDPGIEQGRDLLPQLGYVLLFGPAALVGGAVVVVLARSLQRAGLIPTWLAWAGYGAAGAQLFAIFSLPLGLLSLWSLAVGLTVGRTTRQAVP